MAGARLVNQSRSSQPQRHGRPTIGFPACHRARVPATRWKRSNIPAAGSRPCSAADVEISKEAGNSLRCRNDRRHMMSIPGSRKERRRRAAPGKATTAAYLERSSVYVNAPQSQNSHPARTITGITAPSVEPTLPGSLPGPCARLSGLASSRLPKALGFCRSRGACCCPAIQSSGSRFFASLQRFIAPSCWSLCSDLRKSAAADSGCSAWRTTPAAVSHDRTPSHFEPARALTCVTHQPS